MVSSGMLRLVVLVRTDVSEELSAPFIRVTRIGELGTTLAGTSIRHIRYKVIHRRLHSSTYKGFLYLSGRGCSFWALAYQLSLPPLYHSVFTVDFLPGRQQVALPSP
jgi:hypothetical protein